MRRAVLLAVVLAFECCSVAQGADTKARALAEYRALWPRVAPYLHAKDEPVPRAAFNASLAGSFEEVHPDDPERIARFSRGATFWLAGKAGPRKRQFARVTVIHAWVHVHQRGEVLRGDCRRSGAWCPPCPPGDGDCTYEGAAEGPATVLHSYIARHLGIRRHAWQRLVDPVYPVYAKEQRRRLPWSFFTNEQFRP